MERAASARDAVQLMGDLAVRHGFHGQSASFEGGAESLDSFETHVYTGLSGRGERRAKAAA